MKHELKKYDGKVALKEPFESFFIDSYEFKFDKLKAKDNISVNKALKFAKDEEDFSPLEPFVMKYCKVKLGNTWCPINYEWMDENLSDGTILTALTMKFMERIVGFLQQSMNLEA